jgi:K+/H+ antiporter YhaU regulatory subunit KhtT
MIAILTLIFVIAISMLITKVATIALINTGMTRERARFQARSAFTGAGFTTSESEIVVKHPVRRRIIMTLILLGNAGIVTAVSTLILGFVGSNSSSSYMVNALLLFLGISLLYLATRSRRLDDYIERLINRFLSDYTNLRPRKLETLMTLMEDYEVTEISVDENNWLKGSCLKDLKLIDEGILILGIIRDETYVGIPRGRYEIQPEDKLIIYGKADNITDLCNRDDKLRGRQSHKEKVEEHREEMEEQDKIVESS